LLNTNTAILRYLPAATHCPQAVQHPIVAQKNFFSAPNSTKLNNTYKLSYTIIPVAALSYKPAPLMKNLIKLLALATLSLTACQKTQYADEKKDTNPKIGINGHLVDSNNHALANGSFYTATISPSTLSSASANAMNINAFHFRTNANGDFQVTIRVKEEGDSIYIYPDVPMARIRAAAFNVNPPIEKWIDLGTLKVNNYHQ
jgi:hypothetical protein